LNSFYLSLSLSYLKYYKETKLIIRLANSFREDFITHTQRNEKDFEYFMEKKNNTVQRRNG
jgi:hypothetical protein